jgi:hypothetical protein
MAYQRASSSNDVIHQRAFDMEPRATQVASKCCDAPISRSRPMRPDRVHDLRDQAIASVLRLAVTECRDLIHTLCSYRAFCL